MLNLVPRLQLFLYMYTTSNTHNVVPLKARYLYPHLNLQEAVSVSRKLLLGY